MNKKLVKLNEVLKVDDKVLVVKSRAYPHLENMFGKVKSIADIKITKKEWNNYKKNDWREAVRFRIFYSNIVDFNGNTANLFDFEIEKLGE